MEFSLILGSFYAYTNGHMYEIYSTYADDGVCVYVAWCYTTTSDRVVEGTVERYETDSLRSAKAWCRKYDRKRQAHLLEKQQDRYRIYN
jgi:hypothetical protein